MSKFADMANTILGINPQTSYVGFLNHEEYKTLYISSEPLPDYFEYKTSCASNFFVVVSNDESIAIHYKGETLQDIVDIVNSEDWGNEDDDGNSLPNNFTIKDFIAWINGTYHDSDSGDGYYLIDNIQKKVLSGAANGEMLWMARDDFSMWEDNDEG